MEAGWLAAWTVLEGANKRTCMNRRFWVVFLGPQFFLGFFSQKKNIFLFLNVVILGLGTLTISVWGAN